MERDSSPSSQSTPSSESPSKSAGKVDEDGNYLEEDSEDGDVDTAIRRKRRKGRHRSEKLYVDMY